MTPLGAVLRVVLQGLLLLLVVGPVVIVAVEYRRQRRLMARACARCSRVPDGVDAYYCDVCGAPLPP